MKFRNLIKNLFGTKRQNVCVKIVDQPRVDELPCLGRLGIVPNDRWKIYMKFFDQDGNVKGCGVHPQDYAHRSSALRRAKQLFGQHGENKMVEWVIGLTNPWEEFKNELS